MDITLGQLGDIAIKVVAVISALSTLYALIIVFINNKIIKPIRIKMLKSDLATLMCLADRGLLSESQKTLAYEEYDEYIGYKQNSWVHNEWERLSKEGKI